MPSPRTKESRRHDCRPPGGGNDRVDATSRWDGPLFLGAVAFACGQIRPVWPFNGSVEKHAVHHGRRLISMGVRPLMLKAHVDLSH